MLNFLTQHLAIYTYSDATPDGGYDNALAGMRSLPGSLTLSCAFCARARSVLSCTQVRASQRVATLATRLLVLWVPLALACVAVVVGSGADIQMVRAYAPGIVAAVAYVPAFGNRSDRMPIGEAVSVLPDLGASAAARETHAPVSVYVAPSVPMPTAIGLRVDACPEFLWRHGGLLPC